MRTLPRILFADTSAARMLRMVQRGEMWAADFMREYHRVCARGTNSRSSFGCNFARYLLQVRDFQGDRNSALLRPGGILASRACNPMCVLTRDFVHVQWTAARTHPRYASHATGCQRLVVARYTPTLPAEVYRGAEAWALKRGASMLWWSGPARAELLAGMSHADLQWSYESMERQLFSPRTTDDPGVDLEPWVMALKLAVQSDPRAGAR